MIHYSNGRLWANMSSILNLNLFKKMKIIQIFSFLMWLVFKKKKNPHWSSPNTHSRNWSYLALRTMRLLVPGSNPTFSWILNLKTWKNLTIFRELSHAQPSLQTKMMSIFLRSAILPLPIPSPSFLVVGHLRLSLFQTMMKFPLILKRTVTTKTESLLKKWWLKLRRTSLCLILKTEVGEGGE